MSLYARTGKRVFDFFGALLMLPVLGAAMLIAAPLIKISDGGPVFYGSRRRGMNGGHFTMLKFRSMTVDAPDLRNKDLSTVNDEFDPRVTALGRVLRKTSVDELPQLINVLRGDMSFVGPRPNMTRQTWEELGPLERKRIQVRPGITGLSQAFYRNSASTAQKYRIDCLYVDRISLGLDTRVLLQTVRSVIGARNINGTSSRESGAL